jgi:hypothetical protein
MRSNSRKPYARSDSPPGKCREGCSDTGDHGEDGAREARRPLALNHCSTTNSRNRPDPAGHHRTQTRSTPDRIRAGQGSFVQVVAGVGFEPT